MVSTLSVIVFRSFIINCFGNLAGQIVDILSTFIPITRPFDLYQMENR